MPSLSRRGFIALGGSGAAGLILASCGEEDDPRAEGSDDELLSAALGAETALQGAYNEDGLAGITPARAVISLQEERISELGELGAETPEAPEAGGDVVDASNAAIAAYRELAGVGSSTEVRAAGTRGLAEIAAVLAAVSAEDPAPTAFVTGGAEDPYEPEVEEPAETATAEDTETTSTTEAGG